MMETITRHPVDVPGPESGGPERRGLVRFATSAETCCHSTPPDRGDFWSARVVDVSNRGVGLEVNRRFKPNTRLALELGSGVRRVTQTYYIRVVHSQRIDDQTWMVGCEFEHDLSDQELKALVSGE